MTRKAGKRRWFSFSLKTLLLLAFVVCVASAWLGMRLDKARRQRESVAAVEQLGGRVLYEYQEDHWDKPSGPEWLRNVLGRHFFDRVVRVAFTNRGIPNDRVTNISFLSGLDHLRLLYLDGTAVRDISLLAEKKELWFLSIGGTQIEDLSPLANLRKLQTISLDRTNVSDLSPLRGHKLKRIWMRSTQVSDISVLADMDGLVFLDLYKTLVSDISPLSSAYQLESLTLNWTKVSDITPLMKLKRLKSLDVRRTNVTSESVRELQEALPDCHIDGPLMLPRQRPDTNTVP